jgi:hypothetical protein
MAGDENLQQYINQMHQLRDRIRGREKREDDKSEDDDDDDDD